MSAAAPQRTPRDNVALANRILALRGIVDGFGHVSVRHDENPERFLIARSMAPALVTPADIVELDLDGAPTQPDTPTCYLERFIHSEIYKSRPDVMAIVHHHAPSIIPFGATRVPLRPLYHMSGFLTGGIPVFDIRCDGGETDMLISSPALGAAHARCLGPCSATLMRGHGATVTGASLPQVVYRSIYMELNARLQADAMRLGEAQYLSDEEARLAVATNDKQVGRPWALWVAEAERADPTLFGPTPN
jgi:ribulose-5-phosphate 4-epimerase/fuculose-1-phosphate aldolase